MSNNNATVALPGHDNWDVWWSPQSGFDNFQLDIVGFLAILGESSVQANAQVAALSRIFYLPRLLPAPQALLKTTRPTTLTPTTAKVTGVASGNKKDHVHHVANILFGGEPKDSYTVQHVKVVKIPKTKTSYGDILFRGTPRRARNNKAVLPPQVRAKATGPLFWVTLIGFLEVVILFTCSILFGDGMSLLATILLGGLSTVVGVCNKWTLKLSKPAKAGDAPPPKGDAVIRYPNGSYLIVECTEEVARELFFAPEELDYNVKSETTYRLLSLLGTVMLMLGVIALANAKLQLQFGWAGAFIIINIAHWVAAALPQKKHWDLTCYKVIPYIGEDGEGEQQQQQHSPKKSRTLFQNLTTWFISLFDDDDEAEPNNQDKAEPEKPNFTTALWKSILLTRSTAWVRLNDAAPSTIVWDEWLEEAKIQAEKLWNDLETEIIISEKKPSTFHLSEPPSSKGWDSKRAWDELNMKHNPPPAAAGSTASTPAAVVAGATQEV